MIDWSEIKFKFWTTTETDVDVLTRAFEDLNIREPHEQATRILDELTIAGAYRPRPTRSYSMYATEKPGKRWKRL